MFQAYILDSGMQKKFWGEALMLAVHVYNWLPHKANPMNQPSIVLWSKEKPSLDHIQVFGSNEQVLDRSKSKLGPNTCEGKYLGPAVDDIHFYHIRMTNREKVIQTHGVTFLENESIQLSSQFQSNEGQKPVTKARIDRDSDSDSKDENLEVLEITDDRSNLDGSYPSSEDNHLVDDESTDIHQKEHVESQPTSLPEVSVLTTVTEITKSTEATRNKRNSRSPSTPISINANKQSTAGKTSKLKDDYLLQWTSDEPHTPNSYKKAINSPDADNWFLAEEARGYHQGTKVGPANNNVTL